MKERWGPDKNVLLPTPGDPRVPNNTTGTLEQMEKGKQKSPGRATSSSRSQPLTPGGREKVTQINVCIANKQMHGKYKDQLLLPQAGERGGSVVECRTPEREVRGSRPTAAVLCPWARHFTPRKYWLITQEAMAPSWYDWKIVGWDVKPQHNQPTKSSPSEVTCSWIPISQATDKQAPAPTN